VLISYIFVAMTEDDGSAKTLAPGGPRKPETKKSL
jgi:hypothetical protein